ncbi:MAG TPA: fused MFS/spermidine synthase [Vicinamibacterales bacterium]|nr:fused MFS/spermidine synthase [Vicinamibacterales bacterium]
MRAPVVRAALVVFIASFCTLVIELVAGRILAPYVGVSLYTWTSIIGVVLAGISAGAYAGGWLADRRPAPSTLGWLLLASGLTALLVGPSADLLASDDGVLTQFGIARTLLHRVTLLSFLLFFLPSFFLGMISPVAVKLGMRDLDTTGRVVGKIYAFSTLGSIAGTFLTGFYLVARFGTRATLIGVGVALILSAFIFGDLLGRLGRFAALLFVTTLIALFAFGPRTFAPPSQRRIVHPTEEGMVHFEESQYYTIRVEQTVNEDDRRALQALHLDHLIHSFTDLQDPSYLAYAYLEIFNEAIRWKAKRYGAFRLLFIGGGGYTLPRLTERAHPGAEIDVVEIDPAVTRVAHRFFDLPRRTRINTINEDARWFAMRADREYDVIFIDAFNDLSVPYHLTTRELTLHLRERLAPDGALVANVIDNFDKGRFLASYVKTLQSVFGERNVAVILESEEDAGDRQSTYVVVASAALSDMLATMYGDRTFGDPVFAAGTVLPHARLQKYLRDRNAIVLTDDYVPVDNMLAPLFAERFVEEAE